MTFEYSEFADVMVVSISEPSSPCVQVESQTPGIILRVEESTGIVRSFEVLLWSRRISADVIIVPEIIDLEFQAEWVRNLSFSS